MAIHDPLDIEEAHYDEMDIIVHGHTHRYRNEFINNTYIFNPGGVLVFLKGRII